jgi:hypothetical protein
MHGAAMKTYRIKVRTANSCSCYTAVAPSSSAAWADAAAAQGETPCGITVTPAGPQQ